MPRFTRVRLVGLFVLIAGITLLSFVQRGGNAKTNARGNSAPEVATIAATMTSSLVTTGCPGGPSTTDLTCNGIVNPGDTIRYAVTITNNGDTAATGVNFSDTVPGTTAVQGSAVTSPIAQTDVVSVTGNVKISTANGALNLKANDIRLASGDNTNLTVTAETKKSTACAAAGASCPNNVTINADGTFSYNPPAGFEGADSFTYTETDTTIGPANGLSSTGNVKLTVSGMIWFIDASQASNGDGRLGTPFNCLRGPACFDTTTTGGAADDPNDNIFLYSGNYTGGFTLLSGQKLIGQGASTTLAAITGLTIAPGSDPLPTLAASSAANPVLSSTASITDNVRLTNGSTGNTIRGITVGDSGAPATGDSSDISGTNFGTLAVNETILNGIGRTLNLTGPGNLNGNFTSVSTTKTNGQGMTLTNIGGSVNMGSTTISGQSIQCISVSGVTADINFGNTSCTNTGEGIFLSGNSAGTRTFGTLSSTGGNAGAFIHSNNGAVGGGDTTITGDATISTSGNAISVSSPANGDLIDFQAAATVTTSTNATGIAWTGAGAGSTAELKFNRLTLQRNNGIALQATVGGKITVTNALGSSTINNTTDGGPAIVANAVDLNTTFSSINCSGSGGGTSCVSLTNVSGTNVFGSGALSGSTAATFLVSGGTVSTAYSGNISQSNNAALVSVTGGHTGTLTFDTGTLTATNGTGLQFDNADGTYNFNGTNTLNNSAGGVNANAGINIVNGSGGDFSFSSNSSISGQTSTSATAFNVNGGAGGITYAGTIDTTSVATDNQGTTASITNRTGGSVTVSGNINDSTDSGGGIGISNNTGGTITFSGPTKTLNTVTQDAVSMTNNNGATVSFTGGGLDIDTTTGSGFLASVAGTYNVTGSGNDITTTGTGRIVNMDSVSVGSSGVGFGTLQSSGTVSNNAITLNNVDGANTFSAASVSIAGTSGATSDGIHISGGSSATFSFNGTTTIGNTSNDGINLSGANGTVSFNSVALNGMAGDGIDVSGNTTGVTVSGGTVGNTNDPAGVGVRVGSGTGNVSIVAAITKTTAGHVVDVSGHTGGTVTFSGALSATGPADNGVSVTSNTGGTITFSGGMNVSTGANTAFNVTGGGTVNVCDENPCNNTATGALANTLTTTTATALNIASTTIGANNLEFKSISAGTAASGPASGITLNTTGSTGGLKVKGDGTAANNGSGGTIQKTTGDGVSLTSTGDLSLNQMNITNNLGDGIGGGTINGFVLNRVNISGNGNDAATDESGINLTEVTGTASAGLHPTSITNCNITNNNEFEIQITNTTGTLTSFEMSGNTVSSDGVAINGNASSPHGNLFNFLGHNTATMTLNVTSGNFTGDWNSASPPATITGTGISAVNQGTSTTINVSGTTFTNNNAGIDVSSDPVNTTLTFTLQNNTIVGSRSTAINAFQNGNPPYVRSINGKILNNIIGNDAVTNSGSNVGRGIDIDNEGAVPLKILVSGNTIQQIQSFEAISVQAGLAGIASSGGLTEVTVINNTIRHINGSRGLIYQELQDPTLPPFASVCGNVSGNSFSNIVGQAGNGQFMRFREGSGTLNVTQATPTAAANPAEVDDANGFNDATKVSIGGTPQFSQAACAQPPIAPPADEGAENLEAVGDPLGEMATAELGTRSALGEMASAELETAPALGEMASAEFETRTAGSETTPALGEMASAELETRPAALETTPAAFDKIAAVLNTMTSQMSPTVYAQEASPENGENVSVAVGTLEPGTSVTIYYDVKIDPVGTLSPNVFQITNNATVSGSNFSDVITDGDAVAAGRQDTLTKVVEPEVFTKQFNPTTMLKGAQTTLTFNVTNNNPADTASQITFTDTFPAAGNFTIASPVTTTNTCGGTLTDAAGGALDTSDNSIKLAGGALGISPTNTCTVTVKVTSTTTGGPYLNTAGPISSLEGAVGLSATANVTVSALTASAVSVSGRVVTQDGRGVTNARVSITDSAGVTRIVTTGRGGAFNFDDVPSGYTYTVSVASQRFTFVPQVIAVTDQVQGMNFVAQ